VPYTITSENNEYAVDECAESGLLKLQVSFAEYRLFFRALLQKRPVILRSLPITSENKEYAVRQKTPIEEHQRARAGNSISLPVWGAYN